MGCLLRAPAGLDQGSPEGQAGAAPTAAAVTSVRLAGVTLTTHSVRFQIYSARCHQNVWPAAVSACRLSLRRSSPASPSHERPTDAMLLWLTFQARPRGRFTLAVTPLRWRLRARSTALPSSTGASLRSSTFRCEPGPRSIRAERPKPHPWPFGAAAASHFTSAAPSARLTDLSIASPPLLLLLDRGLPPRSRVHQGAC